MAGRMRVHELARELGVSSVKLLRELKSMGEFVSSASSTLESAVVAGLRLALGESARSEPAALAVEGPSADDRARAEAELRAFLERPPSSVDSTEEAVEEQVRRDWAPPFRAPTAAARQVVPPRPSWPARRSRRPTVRPSSPLERLALSLAHDNVDLAEAHAEALVVWVHRGFGLDEVVAWLRGGLTIDESGLAERCRRAGLAPADMARNAGVIRVLSRLRRGESPGYVAKRLRERARRRA